MYDLAVKMIKDGNAYCDDTPVDTMREQRMVVMHQQEEKGLLKKT